MKIYIFRKELFKFKRYSYNEKTVEKVIKGWMNLLYKGTPTFVLDHLVQGIADKTGYNFYLMKNALTETTREYIDEICT